MRVTLLPILLTALLGLAICQSFPSSSQTWAPQGNNDRVINITGSDAPPYPTGHTELSIHVSQGSGLMFFGLGDIKRNTPVRGSSFPYVTVVPFCALDNDNKIDYYVHLESTQDLRYKVTLTHFSSQLPNNQTMWIHDLPDAFKRTPYWIIAGDEERSKTVNVSITSGVPLDSYMSGAIVQARQKCSAEIQNQTFSVPTNSTSWTFSAQFDAGYENYTINFRAAEIVTVFSSFSINASVKLGPKQGLGKWIFLIIGGAAVVAVVAIIGTVLYVRSRKGYMKIQDN